MVRILSIGLVLVMLFATAGCQNDEAAAANLESLKGHLDEFRGILMSGDAGRLAALYPSSPSPIGYYPAMEREGKEAVAGAWSDWLGAKKMTDVEFFDTHWRMKQNLGTLWGRFRVSFEEGGVPGSVEGRFTRVLGIREGGAWEVLHEHVSMPLPAIPPAVTEPAAEAEAAPAS